MAAVWRRRPDQARVDPAVFRFAIQTVLWWGGGVHSSVGDSNCSRVAAVVVVLAVFMTNLDLWIVNVALPAMGASFGSGSHAASLGALSWVLNAYALTLAALLVVMGRLGDRVGQRSVFLAGVA